MDMCWKCGKKQATVEKYGYPVCEDCAEELDPEEMEVVVIESLGEGRLVPLDEIGDETKNGYE